MRFFTICFLGLFGCSEIISSESESESTVINDRSEPSGFDDVDKGGASMCGLFGAERNGIRIPVECVPFYIEKGRPPEQEQKNGSNKIFEMKSQETISNEI